MVLQVSTRFPPRVLAVIALGGILGALGRVAIADVLGTGSRQQLIATLSVNIVGALLIGITFPWIRERTGSPLLQPFLITGVLGGFTTFSTFAADVVLTDESTSVTLVYMSVTLVAGLLAVPAGAWFYRKARAT